MNVKTLHYSVNTSIVAQQPDLYRSRNGVVDPRVKIRLSIYSFVVTLLSQEDELNFAESRTR